MNTFRKSGLIILGIMSIVLPIWLTLGKAFLFHSGGWVTLVYIFTVAPFIFITFWIFFLLLSLRKDVKEFGMIGKLDSAILIAIYASVFLHGVFIVDGGDTPESVGSVASNVIGMSTSTSDTLALVFGGASLLLIVAAFILFLYELVSRKSLQVYR